MAGEDTGRSAAHHSAADRPLRIAICLSHFYPTIGGAERQALQLARQWTAWGHEVRVITRPVPGLPRRETLDGIEIRRSIHTVSLGPLFGVTFVGRLAASLLRLAARYDVVLAAQAPWEAVATGLVRRITGKPTVVRLANAGPYGDLRQLQQARGRSILTRLVKSNDLFVALSRQAGEELRRLGCPPDKIRQLTNGVDTVHYAPPPSPLPQRDRTVLFVGRLSEQKNPLALLRSWQRVNARREYQLLMAGEGPLESSARQLAVELQLGGIEWLGSCRDLRSVYHRASVFVLPSLSEGCSNALLEAMASGLCPVATNIGGNSDVIADGVNGRLVEARHDQQLTDVLGEVLADRDTRQRLALAAREHVMAHHDAQHVARQYLNAFVDLME